MAKAPILPDEATCSPLIAQNPDALLVIRQDGTLAFVNCAAERLLGKTRAQLVDANFGIPVVAGEITDIDIVRSGTGYVADMRLAAIVWQGQPAHLATLRDVTARKRAREALQFSANAGAVLAGSLDPQSTLDNVARLAVQHLADWCIIDRLQPDGTVRRLAAAHPEQPHHVRWIEELNGVFPLATAERLRRVLLSGPECHPTVNAQLERELALDGNQVKVFEKLGCASLLIVPMVPCGQPEQPPARATGAITFVRARPGQMYDPDEQTLAQDLARRAALALENARLLQECREAIEKRDHFMALLAHELRNPLAPILSAAQLLRLQGVAQSGRAQAAVEAIERQGKHLARLVDDLLDLSRLTHGKILLRREIVDLKSAVLEALQALQPHLDARRQRLTLNLEAEAIQVDADPTRLAQILANLLQNACRYTDEGGKIELRTSMEGKDAVVRVKDSGVGIPEEMLTRIFEPFIQVEPKLDRAQGGLGLGLAIVRQLVEKHGGKVRAHSNGTGLGSLFEVRLPLVTGVALPLPADPVVAEPATRARTCQIALIEDNADAREMLRDLLQLSGYPVLEAANGRDGLALLLSACPEIAIIDIGLPELDGYQIAREIRAALPGITMKLIALTGYAREEDRLLTRAAGFDAHLVKPVDLDQLQRLLLA